MHKSAKIIPPVMLPTMTGTKLVFGRVGELCVVETDGDGEIDIE